MSKSSTNKATLNKAIPIYSADSNGNVFGVSGTAATTYLKSTYDLTQSAIPLVLPSSGIIGSNGALTLTTALPTTYSSGAFMYFPAAAIGAGTAAGMYWVVMSSTTVGTIYNNGILSGTPAVPSSPTAFSGTAGSSYTQTTGSFLHLLDMTLPGNTLGPNGGIEVQPLVTCPNNSNTKSYGWQINGGNVLNNGLTTSNGGGAISTLRNRGVTNAQFGVNAANSDVGGNAGFGNLRYLSVDTTASATISLNGQLAVATDYLVYESYKVTVYPKP